jgi:hypothetical protein
MSDILYIKDFIEDPNKSKILPIMDPIAEKINEIKKNRFGKIVGGNYILEYISNCISTWKNLLNNESITKDRLPYNLEIHIKKANPRQKIDIIKTINWFIAVSKNPSTKKQLIFLKKKIKEQTQFKVVF